MNLSKKWMSDYVKLDVSDKVFTDEMTMSGSKVEGVEYEGEKLKNIVVAEILSLERHPDSDHLWITSVNIGEDEPVQIVTGAQNLQVGDFVPAALHNSYVANGTHITKGKLRGVQSNGMLCSLSELGLNLHDFPYAAEDGIFVLGDDCEKVAGMDIKEAIGLNDTVIEFEITSNRPDCLSITGLAREAAATFKTKLNIPEPVVKYSGGSDVKDMLKVSISAPDKCYRYIGAVVKNVKIEPSPRWMRERLRACGVRPINNIVDIANYVMLEFGQPMHAFDLRFLEGNEVIVRNARAGETITTLDDIERELDESMLVIADAKKPVAVAGVMGGEFSGIMDDTTTIVFESACFYGINVRATAKKLGMRTESSARFEKQLDPNGCLKSQLRALELVEMLGAGEVVNGLVDVYPTIKEQVTLPFEPDWVNKFIGIDVSADEQKTILERLGFKVENDVIYAPTFRIDIEHQADISEEIARFYGYENIPSRELSGVAAGYLTEYQAFERAIRSLLIGLGSTQIETFSFISPKYYDNIRLPEDKRESVDITNPLGEETSIMRTTALPSMMEVLVRNINYRNASASLFELATEYIPRDNEELPLERVALMLGLYGSDTDFYTLKGMVERVFYYAGVKYKVEAVSDNPSYHPGRTAKFVVNGKDMAILGEIHPSVCDNYDVKNRIYAAEIDFDALFAVKNTDRKYTSLPKFPAMTRDLAFVCDRDIPVGTLAELIENSAGKLLEELTLFDVYQGEQIAADKKSVAFSLRLRATDRTLTDEEADAAVKKAITALSEIGAVLRA